MMGGGGDTVAPDQALASRRTTTLRLPETWLVQIVYFIADLDAGGRLTTHADPYGYDARLLAARDGRDMEVASR